MNLNQIQYFITLAQVEHYTQASKLLCITQPSLSHAIAMLEEELGVCLFEKQGRNIVLTKYGKEFYRYAKASQDILKDGIQKMEEMSGAIGGHISIGYIHTQGSVFIPEVVKGFVQKHSDKKIRFSLENNVTKTLIEGLKQDQFDVIFCSKSEREKEMEFIPIAEERLVVVVPNHHVLAKKNSVSIQEVAQYPQICFPNSSGLHFVILELFRKHHIIPNVAYEIAEDSAMAGMVAQDLGIAIMPDIPALPYMPVRRIELKELEKRRYIYMATRKEHYQSPIVKEFIDYVKQCYEIVV